jgi:CubicO group peptidase (beta-lactamase class C family)
LREASCGKARVMNPGCQQAEVDVLPASASSALRQRLATLPTTSLMVRQQGRLLFSWGDTTIPSYIASIRKSVLSLLMGRHVASGRIRLDATLGDLGIDDVQPLTDIEKTARVRDLLCSRSGVYHPAGSAGGDVPLKRGARRPGEEFAYNNWDFNVLETIFENATSLSVHEAFEQDLTGPLGLTDHAPSSHRVLGDPSRSRHLAHHFFLSARELMSIGQLVLNHGVAAGCRIVPPEWLTQVLTPRVDTEDVGISPFGSVPAAYGYLWWLPRMDGDPRWSGAAVAAGNYGQYLLILPRISTVIVHRRFVSREFAVGRNSRRADVPGEKGPTGVRGADFLRLARIAVDSVV